MSITRCRAARTVIVAGVGLALALTTPAVADAQPIWDIEVYDSCVTKADNDYVNGTLPADDYADRIARCCSESGGQWVGGPISGWCTAPPPRAADAPPIAPGGSAGVSDDPPPPTVGPKPAPVVPPTVIG